MMSKVLSLLQSENFLLKLILKFEKSVCKRITVVIDDVNYVQDNFRI